MTSPASNGASAEMAVMSGAAPARVADARSTVGVHGVDGVLGAGAGGVAAPGPGKRFSRRRRDALRRPRCDML